MSSHKKRRIEGGNATKPMSAIAALAARRREAAASSTSAQQSSECDEKQPTSNVNYFSPLQKGNSQVGTPSTPKKSAVKAPRPHFDIAHQLLSRPPGSISPEFGTAQRAIPYSSFRLSDQNHRVKKGGVVELRLSGKERFTIIGSFGIKVIQGEVVLAGATLYPAETIEWVHAPYCHAVPVLRTKEQTRLELHPDKMAQGLRQLSRLSPLFRKMWNEPPEGDSTKSNKEVTFQIVQTPEDAPKKCIIQELDSLAAWNRKLSCLVTTSREKPSLSTLICGPKSAGKSTLSRLFLNRLLTDRSHRQTLRGVVVMDLDPGQPEYAPAGTLSLVFVTKPNLGAPFTHPGIRDTASNVVRCHSMASVTPASDPDLYLACAVDLFDTYNKSFAGVPLIVNTPGWILGTGLDLLCALVRMMKPEEVLYMSEDGPSETVDALRAATETTFTELPSQQSEFTSRTAAHLRAMQTMSYFHLQDLALTTTKRTDITQRLKWNPSPLSFRPPLLVRYSSKKGIFGLVSYDYQCPPELLADTVNGLVLAAVEIEDVKAFSRFTQDQVSSDISSKLTKLDAASKDEALQMVSTSPEGIPYIPNYNDAALDPRYSRTIGLVLLRGIDTKSHTLQLTTPIPAEEFKHIKSEGRDIVLLHGKFDTPSWAYTEDLYERAGADEGSDTIFEVTDEDTDDDKSEAEPEDVDRVSDLTEVPWVEVLKGSQRRPVGSRVWRVRRDLGRNNA
ncbi:Polynucleotide 5'-hydroxyl-kinase grc3 [Fusarium musae]|uniref:Polynucleotide 5'-hydroxyl-kinase GRC3 n=1 Tax=Fusarium musae TaxID=1042133 RepID=A0A9P8DU61_9HYPO|nr:Polynucleotide 5'-hydroxyl-kinase grc3 [Fusarium musae]KAG9507646.1 Polynucleotide 5'-hydroxyl-kinase grc3 [Fusarium musae]